jgi:hypothetical protein
MNKAVARPGHGFRLAMVVVAGAWLAATPQVEATILLHESFGFSTNHYERLPQHANPHGRPYGDEFQPALLRKL